MIVRATTADQYACGGYRVVQNRIDDRLCSQFHQRGHDIGRRQCMTLQVRLQPGGIEMLPAGAFGRRRCEIIIGKHVLEQAGSDVSGCGIFAASIVRFAEFRAAPGVQQYISRSGIETGNAPLARWQQGDIGNAADVHHCAILVWIVEYGVMECRNQWCTLSAERDIAPAKISHYGYAGTRGDYIRISDLQTERMLPVGTVADRLAVAADRPDPACRKAGLQQQFVGGAREPLSQFGIKFTGNIQRIAADRTGGKQQDALSQFGRVCQKMTGEQLRSRLEFYQRCIDTIGAGTGHQADEVLIHAVRTSGENQRAVPVALLLLEAAVLARRDSLTVSSCASSTPR